MWCRTVLLGAFYGLCAIIPNIAHGQQVRYGEGVFCTDENLIRELVVEVFQKKGDSYRVVDRINKKADRTVCEKFDEYHKLLVLGNFMIIDIVTWPAESGEIVLVNTAGTLSVSKGTKPDIGRVETREFFKFSKNYFGIRVHAPKERYFNAQWEEPECPICAVLN